MSFPIMTQCPALVRNVADNFKDLFPTRSFYKAFVATLCGSIFGLESFSDIARFLLFSPSVSTLCDLFKTPGISIKMSRRQRRMLKRLYPIMWTEPSRFIWAIDDTLIQKTGAKTWGVYTWWDHSKKCNVLAQKLLVIGIVDCKNKIFIPVSWEVLHQDLTDKVEEETSRIHEKAWKIAFNNLQDCVSYGFPKFTVVADSWFGCEELFNLLDENGFNFVMEIKSNRIVESHKRKKFNKSLSAFFKGFYRDNIYFNQYKKYASERCVLLRGSTQVRKIVAVSNEKSLADDCFGYYITNKLTWNSSKVWGIWRNRWSIEVFFRDAKQIFTLGEAAVRFKESVEFSIALSMLALTVIRLEQYAQVGAEKNQYVRPIPAGGIVRDLKLENLQKGISKLAHETLGKSLRTRLSKKLTHKNLNSKPTEGPRSRKNDTGRGTLAKVG